MLAFLKLCALKDTRSVYLSNCDSQIIHTEACIYTVYKEACSDDDARFALFVHTKKCSTRLKFSLQ